MVKKKVYTHTLFKTKALLHVFTLLFSVLLCIIKKCWPWPPIHWYGPLMSQASWSENTAPAHLEDSFLAARCSVPFTPASWPLSTKPLWFSSQYLQTVVSSLRCGDSGVHCSEWPPARAHGEGPRRIRLAARYPLCLASLGIVSWEGRPGLLLHLHMKRVDLDVIHTPLPLLLYYKLYCLAHRTPVFLLVELLSSGAWLPVRVPDSSLDPALSI